MKLYVKRKSEVLKINVELFINHMRAGWERATKEEYDAHLAKARPAQKTQKELPVDA